ncbi:MAG: ABC transporter permease [Rubricoccaceae bacterium]
MWKTDLLVALRQLKHHPGYAALNIVGLAVGLACCLLILLFVQDELSFDTMHPEADRLYRVERDVMAGSSAGPELQRWSRMAMAETNGALAQATGVEVVARVTGYQSQLVVREEERFMEERFMAAEPAFFDLFDVPLRSGTPAELARPFTIVISESVAAKYFGDEDPIGDPIEVRSRRRGEDVIDAYEVVGVMRDLPHNMHLHPDFVASLVSQTEGQDLTHRTSTYYVRLAEETTPDELVAQLDAARPDGAVENQAGYALLPVTDIHLRSTSSTEIEPQGDIRYIWLFSMIALLILLIAGVNYMNLATARGGRRTKEVGVRKSIGAAKHQLVRQFLSESMVVTMGALALALAITALALPWVEIWMSRSLSIPFMDPWLWAMLGGTVLVLSVGAGAYPAFVLSAVQAQSALKGRARLASRTALRKVLVVGQFTATVALIACAIGIQRQLDFVQNTRLGFNPDQTLVVETRGGLAAGGEAFKGAAEQIPGVQQVAFGSGVPGRPTGIQFISAAGVEGQDATSEETFVLDAFWVDETYASVLDLELAEGRFFSAEQPSDADRALIVNESAVRELGWDQPLGKTILHQDTEYEVVGVVRDFHLADMRREIGPVMIDYEPEATSYAVLKLDTANLPETLTALQTAWESAAPDHLFDSFFLDDHFAAMYRAERLVGQVFLAFSLLAVLVACLGLFGLAMLAAEQRTKEIGVRKVLGASVASLVGLLSRESVALVAVGFVIAVPLAYLFLQRWLSDFVYRAEPNAGLFLIAGGVTLAIALATVGIHAVRAAVASPIGALRSE